MKILDTTLPNGLRTLVYPLPHTHSVTLALFLRGGSAYEPPQLSGATHLVEHLCFRRWKDLIQQEFYEKLEGIGAYLRGATFRECCLFELTVRPEFFLSGIGDSLRPVSIYLMEL